ncbi:HK97 family phage prohead protease, partial [Rickettsiaceae bacterium]|nr:HK97 family phage prohead protease [Rickettsiaceae bacterium]
LEYIKQEWICSEFIIKSQNKKNTVISGYASVFDMTDSHGHIIAKGAFKKVKSKDVKLLWQHNKEEPIGVIKSLIEDEYGLKMEAEINNSTRAGMEASELIKQGAVSGLSIGFIPNSSTYNKNGTQVINGVDLVEISIVTFPANQRAEIREIENCDDKKIKNNSYSTKVEKLSNLIKQIEKY